MDLDDGAFAGLQDVAVEQGDDADPPGGAEVEVDRVAELEGARRRGEEGETGVEAFGLLEDPRGADHRSYNFV